MNGRISRHVGFVQECVEQKHMFEICYNYKKTPNMFWFRKIRNIFICHLVNKCYNDIHLKKIFLF